MNEIPSWKKIDFLSIVPSLYINSNTRFHTTFGVFLSILSVATVGILSGYFLVTFFDKREMDVIYIKDLPPPDFVYDMTKKPLAFRLYNQYADDGDPDLDFIDPRIAVIEPYYFIKNKGIPSMIPLEIERCNVTKHLNKEYQNVIHFNYSEYRCIKQPENVKLNLTYDTISDSSTHFNLYIRECINSTLNNNHCYPREVIIDNLKTKNYQFKYYFPNAAVNHFNKTNPISERLYSGDVRVLYDYFYVYPTVLNPINYTSDDGIVFRDYANYISATLDEVSSYPYLYAKDTVVRVPRTFMIVQLNTYAQQSEIYKRTYPKLQTVIASIGGVTNSIFLVSGFIAKFISQTMMFVELSNIIASDSDSENKKKQIKKNGSKNEIIKIDDFVKLDDKSKSVEMVNERTLTGGLGRRKSSINNAVIAQKNPKKRRKLRLPQLIFPFFSKSSSSGEIVNRCSVIIKQMMSCDQVLKTASAFENLKIVLFDNKQRVLFENIKKPTFDYYEKYLGHLHRATHEEIQDIFLKISENDDCVSQNLNRIYAASIQT